MNCHWLWKRQSIFRFVYLWILSHEIDGSERGDTMSWMLMVLLRLEFIVYRQWTQIARGLRWIACHDNIIGGRVRSVRFTTTCDRWTWPKQQKNQQFNLKIYFKNLICCFDFVISAHQRTLLLNWNKTEINSHNWFDGQKHFSIHILCTTDSLYSRCERSIDTDRCVLFNLRQWRLKHFPRIKCEFKW